MSAEHEAIRFLTRHSTAPIPSQSQIAHYYQLQMIDYRAIQTDEPSIGAMAGKGDP